MPGSPGIDTKYVLFIIVFISGILLAFQLYLAIENMNRASQLRVLKNKWQGLEPKRKELEAFNKEYTLFSQDAEAVERLTKQRILWAEKLNKLSLSLPSGIWFNDMIITPKDFTLQGSVLSLQKEEMYLIKTLIDSLKKDSSFFKDFNTLELTSAQRKTISCYEIVDFTLVGSLKTQ